MTLNKPKGVFLEVDTSLQEKSLRFATDPNEEEFNKIFNAQGDQYPSKLIKPFPGFCVKAKEVGSGSKVFVNICQTDAIPPPQDITEQQLQNILESDEPSTFRVPMSIGELRDEKDNKGQSAKSCDVAIHPAFYQKVERVDLFKSFLITIVFEGLKEKYSVICNDEKLILKNKKVYGTLQMHRIQQREVENKMKEVGRSPLIEEVPKSGQKPLIQTISKEDTNRIPEYRLYRRKKQANTLIGEFKFPDIISVKELTLDVGEDRILIEASSKNYLLDIFIPHIRQTACSSEFNKATKILTVTMPLVGG